MGSQDDGSKKLMSRAYQLEMFEYSLKANTIVVMGTGTGKTHVASLRIDAELRRTPNKQVWFTAPNAGLVDQQLRFLSTQLPEYQMRSLTGRDNVDMWGDTAIWETVLTGINVVVATPRVLLDALHNGYVSLEGISLLVFDEAHHCQGNDPSALLMQTFYHPLKVRNAVNVPHVLGLTASPCISDKSITVRRLEATLDAACRSPTLSISEYAQHVHRAVLVRRHFTPVEQEPSCLFQALENIILTIRMQDDPYYIRLVNAVGDIESEQKLKKIERSGLTPAMKELKKFRGNAQHLHEILGSWASDLYISSCVADWHRAGLDFNLYHESRSTQHHRFIDNRLLPLDRVIPQFAAPLESQVSAKALNLIDFLASEYHHDIAVIVFVERRCAARALCQLLQASPLLKSYGIFSYVGSSSVKTSTLYENFNTKTQDAAFLGFRAGSHNLCIATSVAEEGIDVQAVNIVIRYDDPKQLASYLQSRGRARQRNSKIVCFQDTTLDPGKYDKWDRFEKEMKDQYENEERLLLGRMMIDDFSEDDGEVYRVDSTNALLDLNVSVSRLAHFCGKAATPADPIYILDGELGVAVSAKVVLPSSVPPPLREACSCRSWRSEKMAKRDAAFHAVKALHLAGLINDHLTPFEEIRDSLPSILETKLREIPAEFEVWTETHDETPHFAYRIEVSHQAERYLSLIMILRTSLLQRLSFQLSESVSRKIDVSVVPLGRVDGHEDTQAREKTEVLFKAAFQDGSATDSLNDASRISCLLLPEVDDGQIDIQSMGLSDFLRQHKWLLDLQPLLIWKMTRPRPYIWYPPHSVQVSTIESNIAAKQVKKLQIFSKTINSGTKAAIQPQDKEIPLAGCEARGIATVYGPIVLLIPSIIHLVGAALRAQHAGETILKPIGFSSTEYLVPALIAKSASGMYNYERLEFLGDACLKYFTSAQTFFDNPIAPEGILTKKTHEVIGNTRLEEAVDMNGLAPFITTEIPAQKHWKLPKIGSALESGVKRHVLAKTLADTVESILGAAFLDGERDGLATEKCLTTLRLFIPEVQWLSPEMHIEKHCQTSTKSSKTSLLHGPIKLMLGYEFRNTELLVEALTHSTDLVWQPALDRLEFLGDAILDQVIKVRLFAYPDLDPGRLSLCRHALVSHAFLAYCALKVCCEQTIQDVAVDRKGRIDRIDNCKKIELTDLVKFRDASLREPITRAKLRFDLVRDSIESELACGRFPWTLLRSINTPKVCSDIIESLLAAVFIDSQGSLATCENILQQLGIQELLHKIARNVSFEVRTPGAKLRELCAERQIAVSVRSRFDQSFDGPRYIGDVCLDGNINITREACCLEEAKSLVEEAAMEFLHDLRGQRANMEGGSENLGLLMSGLDDREVEDKEGNDDEV